MSGKFVFVLCLCLFSSLLYLRFHSAEIKAFNGHPVHNIDTGLDYATIQEAIDANETSNGHIIRVETGVYSENVVINKTISLHGENKDAAIIDGGGEEALYL